jgi:monovalent cation:H+ antiporter-2, CPA2 family
VALLGCCVHRAGRGRMRGMQDNAAPNADGLTGHVIIAGYGIVGRCVAESLAAHKVPFCIVELNPQTCMRLEHGPVPIIEGDIKEESVLRQAGIERASAVALAMPDEHNTLESLKVVRRLRPDVKVIARCTFSSAGMQAVKLGAAAVVAEQVVAREFTNVLEKSLPAIHPAQVD